jgi:hypothetical protein
MDIKFAINKKKYADILEFRLALYFPWAQSYIYNININHGEVI